MPANSLEKAIALFKQGKRPEAQDLLKKLVGTNPRDPNAWFWLAKTYPTNNQRLKVMETCLEYNPDNERVKQLVDELRAFLAGENKRTESSDGRRLQLKPGDKVRVREDVGEFYADFPDYTILIATKGSEGTAVSFEEYEADFEARRETFGHPDLEMYTQHFFVVRESMNQCLQWPIQFEKVNLPSVKADLICCEGAGVQLVDVAALEMVNGTQARYISAVNVDREAIVKKAYAYQPPQAFHDEHKLNDIFLALALAHSGPPEFMDNQMIYFRHTSLLAPYGLWYRLKLPDEEEAVNIILSLHDSTSRHQGCDWAEIEKMIEINAPTKPLWYTFEQKETLIKWVQRIRADEKKESYQKLKREGNPEIRSRVEGTWLGNLFKDGKTNKKN